MNLINERIKWLRKEENLTQKEFAKRLLFSQSYLSGLENGTEIPSDKTVMLMVHEFGVSKRWLLTGEGAMYDEVYTHDRAQLSIIAEKALLNIMKQLNTNSTAAYASIALCLSHMVDILELEKKPNGEHNFEYLNELSILLVEIASYFRKAISYEEKYDSKDIDLIIERLQDCTYELSHLD